MLEHQTVNRLGNEIGRAGVVCLGDGIEIVQPRNDQDGDRGRGAIPSQLPTRILKQFNEKRPGVAVTPGLQVVRILGFGRVSQAQWELQIIRGERGITRPYAFLDRTGP